MDFQFRSSYFMSFLWALIFTTLVTYSTAITADEGVVPKTEQPTLRRIIRSPPQLFPSRNVLTDLTQLKPPSLSDLNEFRQKMASLANLTALLEQAVAAEKSARNTLQGFVNTLKEQIVGVRKAVNPDAENYWTESKTCGGILVSQTGKITYKLNDYYDNHERCIWTIRANYRSKIKVIFTNGELEKTHDFIAVTELVSNNSVNGIEWNTKRLIQDEITLLEGPLIFITFVSDGTTRGKGFQLDFEGMGTYINSNTIYQHFHFSDAIGHFDSGNLSKSLQDNRVIIEEGTQIFATIIVNPSNWNFSNLIFNVAEDTLDLRPDDCEKTNLGFSDNFPILSHGVLNGCCGRKCEVSNFKNTNGIMMGILKSSDVSEGSHFRIDWSTDTSIQQIESVNTCGGILSGNFGRIDYKMETPYNNHERCLWIIQSDIVTEGEIKIQLVQDGFEKYYDFVTLTYLTNDENERRLETKFLYDSSTPTTLVLLPSAFVILEFYSDDDTIGKNTGFEIIWEIKQINSSNNSVIGLEVEYITEEIGSRQMSCSANKESNAQEMIVINSNKEGTEQMLLALKIDEANNANNFSIYGSERGNFSKINGLNEYQSNDGIIVVLRTCASSSDDIAISWKSEKNTVPEEDAQFIKSDDKCGDILFGESGRITYKLGREYDLNERCTWIIRSSNLSTISLQLMVDGFESCCDLVKVNKVNLNDGIIDLETISISRENRFHTLEASVLMVTFVSDHSVEGTGFVLEFHTKGDSIISANDHVINHSHTNLNSNLTSENPFEPVSIPIVDNLFSINTFAFQHPANLSVEAKLENLQVNECNQDSVALYHMPTDGEYAMLKKLPSEQLCTSESLVGETPMLPTPLTPEQENIQLQPIDVLVAVTKVKTAKADKSLSFKFE